MSGTSIDLYTTASSEESLWNNHELLLLDVLSVVWSNSLVQLSEQPH